MRNDCDALQQVCSGHVLLGQRRATSDMRYRIGTRRQLLSGWHNNRNWHHLPRGQLLQWWSGASNRVHWCCRYLLPSIFFD